ncbi:hypothetical protein DRQ07_05685 [candidate division KSB1 bacterium]|nr:MAG: hypothetical protein DRQ07_05685 [candidate division KSB1 bacterium]
MFLIIIHLFKTEYKDDILMALTSCGIEDGCTFEGMNLQKILEHDYPLFRGLVPSESDKQRFSILITATVDSMETVESFTNLLNEADIDIINENVLQLIAIPVAKVIGKGVDWEK